MNAIKIIKQDKGSKILVVTPLLPGHKISKETKVTLRRNKTPITWISSMGNNNIPTNAQLGINWYKRKYGDLPEYYLMLDNDIMLGRKALDRLYEKLKETPYHIGYAYASFKYEGYTNRNFPAIPFDINRLVKANYISSNSLFKMSVIEEVGLVTDEQFQRLLDWAFLLKAYSKGYMGIPCPEASFVAQSTKNDVSAGDNTDYKIKSHRVYEHFIKPLL